MNRKDIGALRMESELRIRPYTRIIELLPWSQNMGRLKHPGCIGIPSCTSGSYHPVCSILFKNGRSFIMPCWCNTDILSCVIQVIVGQFCNLQSQILLRRIDMVCLSILIHINCHVSRHLSAFKIPAGKHSLFHRFAPIGSKPFSIIFGSCGKHRIFFRHIRRPKASIGATGTYKTIGTRYLVTHSHSGTCCCISFSFQFQMKPHDKLLGFIVVNNFWPLKNTSFGYIVGIVVFDYLQYNTLVFPIIQIFRGITSYPF